MLGLDTCSPRPHASSLDMYELDDEVGGIDDISSASATEMEGSLLISISEEDDMTRIGQEIL